MLILRRELYERILIGDSIAVQVLSITGGRRASVRLGITAPGMEVDREEVRERIVAERAAKLAEGGAA